MDYKHRREILGAEHGLVSDGCTECHEISIITVSGAARVTRDSRDKNSSVTLSDQDECYHAGGQ